MKFASIAGRSWKRSNTGLSKSIQMREMMRMDIPNPSIPSLPQHGEGYSIIHSIHTARKEILESAIQEIHAQILQRNQLAQHLLMGTQHELLDKESTLLNLKPSVPAWCLADEKKISELEHAIAQLNQHERTVRTTHWQDIAKLRKELRELQLELTTLARKQDLLESLMHDDPDSSQDYFGIAPKAESYSRPGD